MKQFLILIAFAFFNINAKAQANNDVATVQQLKVSIENGQLYMNWLTAKEHNETNFEVQASVDGKTFTTIGFVLGANPKESMGMYAFKQPLNKMQPGLKQFRVLQQITTNTAVASEATGISK